MTQVEADENHDIRYPNLPMQGDKEGAAILFFCLKKKIAVSVTSRRTHNSFSDKEDEAGFLDSEEGHGDYGEQLCED